MTKPTPKPSGDLALALSTARDAIGDEAALQRVRAGVLAKVASGGAPPTSINVASAWLGKSVVALLLTAGTGALLHNYNPDSQPPAAPAPPLVAAPPPAPPPQAQPAPAQPLAAAPVAQPAPVRRAKPVSKRIAAAQPTAAPAPCSDATAEVELLSRAQQALRAQPQTALTLLAEHAQRYNCGVLALERDTLRIDAERALGLHAQAEEHARELVTRYPDSAETRTLNRAANSGSDHKNQPDGTPTP